jgi:hypothetical protein
MRVTISTSSSISARRASRSRRFMRSQFHVLVRNARSPGWLGHGFERNALSEALELAHWSTGQAFGILAADEVVAAEFLVGTLVAQDVVGGDKDRVGDRDDRFLVSAAALDAQVLSMEIGVLGAPGGALGGLDQGGPEPAVALAGLACPAFSGGLVVARTDRRPTGGVAVTREAFHLGAELGQDHLGGALGDAGDRAEQFTLALEGANALLDLRGE